MTRSILHCEIHKLVILKNKLVILIWVVHIFMYLSSKQEVNQHICTNKVCNNKVVCCCYTPFGGLYSVGSRISETKMSSTHHDQASMTRRISDNSFSFLMKSPAASVQDKQCLL